MQRVARYLYLGLAWLFLAGVVAQLFLVGMVVVAREMGWDAHRDTGHILAGPLLFMLITMYLGRLPRAVKRNTWILFVVYALQADVVIFLREVAPVVSALHPVLALADFVLIVGLVTAAQRAVREVGAPVPVAAALETPTTAD